MDFFLFQEMLDNATAKTNWDNRGNPHLFADVRELLVNHRAYFAPAESGEYGLAGFIAKKHTLTATGDVFIHRYKDAMENDDARLLGRNLQYFDVVVDGRPVSLLNFHGLWTGVDKQDTLERVAQSKKISEFVSKQTGDFILTGDFNLMPETESVRVLESMNVRNLIRDYHVLTTRTSFYTKPEKFADYMFVSPGVTVKDFRILPDEVSDHAAMYLEFDLQ